MLYREIIAVCSEIHTNTQCGQNVGFVSFKPYGKHSNHWALEGLILSKLDVISVFTLEYRHFNQVLKGGVPSGFSQSQTGKFRTRRLSIDPVSLCSIPHQLLDQLQATITLPA